MNVVKKKQLNIIKKTKKRLKKKKEANIKTYQKIKKYVIRERSKNRLKELVEKTCRREMLSRYNIKDK